MSTNEDRIALKKRLDAILDDRWPLAGKIMAAVDEYVAHERSAGAAPLCPDCGLSAQRIGEIHITAQVSAEAAPLDPERHREAMTLLRMANPRMAIGGASADAWLGEVSAFLREAGTDE